MKTSPGKLAALAFLLLLAVVLFAPMRAGQEDQLSLEPEGLRMAVGDSYTVRCTLRAEDPDQRLSFLSSDARVAAVDPDGTVRALSSGEAVISAQASGGARAQMPVTVVGVPMTELKLNVDELHIDKGQFSGLRASCNADASDTRISWVSSDESVVRVNNSGRIEGVGGGSACVSVVSPTGLSASAKVYVHVAGTAAHISPEQLTLGVGAHVPLKVSYLPLDCTDGVRRWTSSNPGVLTVSEDGVLDARGRGTAYITVVTQDGLTAGMEVLVEDAPMELQLDPARATLERDDTLQMQLMFLEEDGGVDVNVDHLVVWTSSDDSVASVDKNGLVTAKKTGSCRITAAADGMTASCELNVQVSIQDIRLSQTEVYMLREDTGTPIQLKAVITPMDADDLTLIFTTNNDQVATVDENGLVTMTGGYGTAIITASAASGARAEFTVNVVTELPEIEEEPEEAGQALPENAAPYEEIYQQIYDEMNPEPAQTPEPVPETGTVG